LKYRNVQQSQGVRKGQVVLDQVDLYTHVFLPIEDSRVVSSNLLSKHQKIKTSKHQNKK